VRHASTVTVLYGYSNDMLRFAGEFTQFRGFGYKRVTISVRIVLATYNGNRQMMPILPANAWREFRGTPSEKGINQTTHMAMIEDPSGKLHRCYVKICPPNFPTPLTEAIGWLLAEALDLPRPEFAALVMVPLNKLRQHIPLDQHWLNYKEMLSFCVSGVEGKTVSNGWKWTAPLRTARIYKRPEIARISAFDHWVDNQDRNTGNLIVRSDGDCVPIDNEYILYQLLWAGKVPFGINHQSLLIEARKYLRGEAHKRFMVETASQGKLHDAALITATPKLQQLVLALVPDPTVANTLWINIQQYLAGRAHPDWLPAQLGVIV